MSRQNYQIRRWSMTSCLAMGALACLIMVLVLMPVLVQSSVLDRLVALFVYLLLAAMWNALAGFGGLVSIGQQMFIGLGAYLTIRLSYAGIDPFAAVAIAGIGCALVALLVSNVMLQLEGGEFAIGMWVLAALTHMLVNLDPLIQGETGISLIALSSIEAQLRSQLTYWIGLAACVITLSVLFIELRGRTGLAIRAIRDSSDAASSLGIDVLATKRRLFVLAALGAGLAGSVWLLSVISFQPKAFFGVHWTAYMIFMVMVGGLGKFEGALLGACVFFVVETLFASTGVWYLIGLGSAALISSLFFPEGLWGAIERYLARSLLPVGYQLELPKKNLPIQQR